jgi:hypothetical protein
LLQLIAINPVELTEVIPGIKEKVKGADEIFL